MRALILGAALLSLSACSHLDMSRSDARAHIHAWEALRHEISELRVAETITRGRLTQDAMDWNILALEFGDLQHQNATASVDGTRAFQAFAAFQGMPAGGMIPKKARVKRDLANLQGHLAMALRGMAQANKTFMQLEGSDDAYDMLDEAYSIGIWAIDKYTRFLRDESGVKEPSAPQSGRRASEVLRELNGI